MSRKKNRKITHPKDRSDSELLKAAEQAEAACKLKEAFKYYKELSKRYPDKYDETLLRIQIARVEVFLKDGDLESAGQMLASLKGQISNEAFKQLELRVTVAQSDEGTAAQMAWKALDNEAGLEPKTYRLLMESLIFCDSTPPDDRLLENRDMQTILAVREGLIALCEGKGEALSQALSKIPLSSDLAHWKLLLRALEAWYSNDEKLLGKCLQKLSDVEGKGVRIVQGLRLLHDKDSQVTPELLNSAFGIHGLYDLADDLIKIDNYVKKGKLLHAFKFAQRQSPRFLSQESVKDQIMAEGFVRLYEYAPRNNNYRTFINKFITDKRRPASLRLPFMRLNYRLGGKFLDCNCNSCLLQQGMDYLSVLKAKGISLKESAHLKYHLANRLLEQIKTEYDEYIGDGELDECIELLEEALKEDPEMVRAGLLLAKCHLYSKNASRGNALLDELAAKFPEDPAVLFAAGQRCIERKTYVRGLKQLEQAHAINPHLAGLKEKHVEGLLGYALQCYRKGLLDKGRDCFEKMKPHLQECPFDADFVLGSRWMRLRQLEMETSYDGEPEQLKIQVEKEWKGKEALCEIFIYLTAELFGNQKRIKQGTERLRKFFVSNSLMKELEPKDVHALFAYLKHNRNLNGKHTRTEFMCANFIESYCGNYVKERLEDILKLLWALMPDYISPGGILKLTKIWSRADRQNPQLKLLHITALEAFGDPHDELLRNLDKAMETARTRGDEIALRKGSELRKKIEKKSYGTHYDPMPIPDYSGDDDYDDYTASIFEEIYQRWRSLERKERKAFEKGMEAEFGKPIAMMLINDLRKRMKDEKQDNTPPASKKTTPDTSAQMNFQFDK